MDPLTHSATGLFLGRAGLNRYCPQAPWILFLAANAPDVDIVTLLGGQLNYLHYHRHLTHSLPTLPVMALLPVLAVRLFTRKPFRWLAAYAISCLAVASHLLLDWTNVYGIRLLLPFSNRWYRLDLTSVIDLWLWATLLLALIGPVLVRLVNAEIGARGKVAGRGFAVFALLFVLGYNAARAVLHARATAILDARLYAGATPQRVAALPSPINPLAWRGLVETGEFYAVQDFTVLEDFDPSRAAIFYKAEPSPVISAANRTDVFRIFLDFSQFPLERTLPVPEPEGATRVDVVDMRFGTPAKPGFAAFGIIGQHLEVIQAGFGFGELRPR